VVTDRARIAILLVVVAFKLLGEGMRDYFDPKERR